MTETPMLIELRCDECGYERCVPNLPVVDDEGFSDAGPLLCYGFGPKDDRYFEVAPEYGTLCSTCLSGDEVAVALSRFKDAVIKAIAPFCEPVLRALVRLSERVRKIHV